MTVAVTESSAIHLAQIGPWSTDAPTEDGWYWACDISGWIDMINLDRGVPYRLLTAYDLSDFTHSLGPLPRPEPPR